MAQVTECDRCQKVVHLSLGGPGVSDITDPLEVRIPHTRHAPGGEENFREIEKKELCAECLADLERWFDHP